MISSQRVVVRGAVLLAAAATVEAQVQQGFRSFHEGNSLTDPMTATPTGAEAPILRLGKALGDASPSLNTNVVAGSPIDWMWSNQSSTIVNKLNSTTIPFNAVVVQPFRISNGTNPRSEAAAAAQIYRAALNKSPNADLYVYFTWDAGHAAKNTDGSYDWTKWRNQMQQDLTRYQYPLLNILRHEFPTRNVYAIPVQQAFMRIYDEMQLGADVGFANMNEAFDDGGSSVHPHRKIYYMSAVSHVASFHKTSPVGKGLPYDIEMVRYWDPQAQWTQKTGLTAAQANNLQTYAWDAIVNSPGTVMNYNLAFADMTKPTAFTASTTAVPNAQMASINWAASSDNSAVTSYSIYINNELVENSITAGTASSFNRTLSRLTPGTTNEVKIRAWDGTFNFTDTVLNVTTPAQSTNVLAGYDASGVKSNSGQTQLAVKTLAPSITATPVTAGPGMTMVADQYLNFRFVTGSVAATTLAQAITNEEYLTFKMTVADGQKALLDALTFAGNSGNNSGYALFSSATGLPGSSLDAGNAIEQYTFSSGEQDFEFALRKYLGLQGVTGEVEFRIYMWNSPARFGREIDTTSPISYELSVRGSVVPVPEPPLIGLVGALAPALLMRRRAARIGR